MCSALFVALITWHIGFNKNPNDAIKYLSLGSTYSELIKMAGKPSYETDGSLWVEPEHKKLDNELINGCVKEAWYETWLSFIPSKYSFCFNDKDRLIHKYHWQSW